MRIVYLYFLIYFIVYEVDKAHGYKQSCGYESCPKLAEGMLNVHLVPHTHNDVGWVKTIQQYFYGVNHSGVKYILDSVIDELTKNSTRRFIYVEIAFFSRWYRQQGEPVQHVVRELVNRGILEFILGGWCMNDEATTHYNAIIDQHTLAFRWLRETFGNCARPRVAWQIDPFGHSREQASLFSMMGFDALFFGRLDYQDKEERMRTRTMEMMWSGSDDIDTDLFTGVNYNGYSSPVGFQYNADFGARIMDDPLDEDTNVEETVHSFIDYVNKQKQSYATPNVMITMGDDFWYEAAQINYDNMDKLIKHVNSRQSSGSKINVLYSTPSCYLKALNEANITLPSPKTDDFFPYANNAHTFWTGYFTSRPALKYYVRRTNNFLQVCKQLYVMADLHSPANSAKLDKLRMAMGVAQHHDAVSGTEQEHVARDYSRRLSSGISACEELISEGLRKLAPKISEVHYCPLLNASRCDFTTSTEDFKIVLYNAVGQVYPAHWLRIPVASSGHAYIIKDHRNQPLKYYMTSSDITRGEPDSQLSENSTSLLVIQVLPLDQMSITTVSVQLDRSKKIKNAEQAILSEDLTIQNKFLEVTIGGDTGLLKSVRNIRMNATLRIMQTLSYYKSYQGNYNPGENQSSGAYIFRPLSQHLEKLAKPVVTVVKTEFGVEIRQKFNAWISQTIVLRDGEESLRFDWTIGPIDASDGQGKEVVSRYTSDLNSGDTFYTDANGRQIMQRRRDYRETWAFKQTEPVAGNYYPVNSRIYIKDKEQRHQLTILTDRSEGGSSLRSGEIELMLHRRLFVDDHFGVEEPLNEPGLNGKGLIITGSHRLIFDTVQRSAVQHRIASRNEFMSPLIAFSPYDGGHNLEPTMLLTRELPRNVHVLTLEEHNLRVPASTQEHDLGDSVPSSSRRAVLLRLEHFFAGGEDDQLSRPVEVQLKDLFNRFHITSIDEHILGGNLELSDLKRLRWNVKGRGNGGADEKNVLNSTIITLTPMQIRTFVLNIEYY